MLGDNGGTERAAGSGAGGPIKLVAMADLRQDKIDSSYTALNEQLGQYMDVPKERRFVGFDAYKHAIDCLKTGDVAPEEAGCQYSSFLCQNIQRKPS